MISSSRQPVSGMTPPPDVNVSPVTVGSSPGSTNSTPIAPSPRCSASFCTPFLIPDPWPIQDKWARSIAAESNPYVYVLSVVHGFPMPVFFLLGGFFTAMLWQRRGLKEMGVQRLKRIAFLWPAVR